MIPAGAARTNENQAVSRNALAGGQDHDVARDDPCDRNLLRPGIPQHRRLRLPDRKQLVGRVGGAPFLPEPQHTAGQDDAEDDQGVGTRQPVRSAVELSKRLRSGHGPEFGGHLVHAVRANRVGPRRCPGAVCRVSPLQSCRTTLRSELLIVSPASTVMNPSLLNLFMKKFTRDRVVPTISASISWESFGST